MKNDIWLMQKIMMDIFKEESYILKKLKFVILTPRNNSGGAIVRHNMTQEYFSQVFMVTDRIKNSCFL